MVIQHNELNLLEQRHEIQNYWNINNEFIIVLSLIVMMFVDGMDGLFQKMISTWHNLA
jgi:hypothetical protein